VKGWRRWMRTREGALAAIAAVAGATAALVAGSMSDERRSRPAVGGVSGTGSGATTFRTLAQESPTGLISGCRAPITCST
jgi:hypothetical protein